MSDDIRWKTLDDAAQEIGVKRTTLHYYAKRLDKKIQHFPLDKRAYISTCDIEDIKRLRRAAAERKH